MNTIILNDAVVAEKVAAHEAEIEMLQKKSTPEEAQDVLNDMMDDDDFFDISNVLPKGTVAGKVLRAKKHGVDQSYGFVDTSYGDVFVPPSMMADFQNNAKVAVLVSDGPRGKVADRIAKLEDYISWHKDEVLKNVCESIDADREQKLRWHGNQDPSNGWEELKAKCKALGLQLVEIVKETKTLNYGGHGIDYYRFSTPITEEQASEVLDALGGRHAEAEPKGSYDPGHDHIVMLTTDNGFCNNWCGPWTD